VTFPLSADSPRRAAAHKFGVLLSKTMARRQVGGHTLAAASGAAHSAIGAWRAGDNLPKLATAIRIAESLSEPRLAEIVREARTGHCQGCGASFIHEGGKPRLYCRSDCRNQAYRNNRPVAAATARDAALDVLRGELLRIGPIRKQAIGKALTLLTDEEERSPGLVARRRLPQFQAAIEAMCRGCEPDGYCRLESCPLRVVSPLPLAIGFKETGIAVKPEGAWGPSRRAARTEKQREINAVTWSRPGAREAQTNRMKARHGSMTPEERAEWRRKIGVGQRKSNHREKRQRVEATS
jgi:DNA-binding XRE family transcriptional regulator